jgi:cytochrome c oxidase subunit 2
MDTRATYDDVAAVYLPVAVAVFVVFTGAIVLLVWRGVRRASPGGRGSHPVAESIYVGVLAVVVVVLVAVSFTHEARIENARAQGALDVRVLAGKWNWLFRYPAYGIEVAGRPGVPATLVVPARRDVRFSATALDVMHAFWIPERRFQRQLSPGRTTSFLITFPRPDVIRNGVCSMYCGLGHADMRFYVRVLDPAAFDAWAAAHRRGG